MITQKKGSDTFAFLCAHTSFIIFQLDLLLSSDQTTVPLVLHFYLWPSLQSCMFGLKCVFCFGFTSITCMSACDILAASRSYFISQTHFYVSVLTLLWYPKNSIIYFAILVISILKMLISICQVIYYFPSFFSSSVFVGLNMFMKICLLFFWMFSM